MERGRQGLLLSRRAQRVSCYVQYPCRCYFRRLLEGEVYSQTGWNISSGDGFGASLHLGIMDQKLNYECYNFIQNLHFPKYNPLSFSLLAQRTSYTRSSSLNTKALTSILSLVASPSLSSSINALCGTRLALPSVLLSKHLINSTSPGVCWFK
jgi:hypothetical protein